MRTLLYPGSFDPFTVGHLDIATRASRLSDRLIVCVLQNPAKQSGFFPVAQRIHWIQKGLSHLSNVDVQAADGLLVDILEHCGADAVVRGLRTEADFPTESEMARLNWQMREVETIFLVASPAVTHISASWVRQIGRLGGNLSGMVPESIREPVEKGFAL